ncbi:MAG: hypothetical protein H6737_08210 [Alphaproteobacteria bacterium]|nr:hypothetical protein [Alphaproteobacteria bacterium]
MPVSVVVIALSGEPDAFRLAWERLGHDPERVEQVAPRPGRIRRAVRSVDGPVWVYVLGTDERWPEHRWRRWRERLAPDVMIFDLHGDVARALDFGADGALGRPDGVLFAEEVSRGLHVIGDEVWAEPCTVLAVREGADREWAGKVCVVETRLARLESLMRHGWSIDTALHHISNLASRAALYRVVDPSQSSASLEAAWEGIHAIERAFPGQRQEHVGGLRERLEALGPDPTR